MAGCVVVLVGFSSVETLSGIRSFSSRDETLPRVVQVFSPDTRAARPYGGCSARSLKFPSIMMFSNDSLFP